MVKYVQAARGARSQAGSVQGLPTWRIEAALPNWIPAAVLLREIQELGYPGGVTQLEELSGGYKHRKPEPMVRLETPPGKQMQADFTHIRRGREPLMAFAVTLGCCRSRMYSLLLRAQQRFDVSAANAHIGRWL